MTARQPRRARRRAVPSSLPRPSAESHEAQEDGTEAEEQGPRVVAARRRAPIRREHHVTEDYGYVHRDLLMLSGVGVVVLAFIFAMSFVI